jgi:hypothetical protein
MAKSSQKKKTGWRKIVKKEDMSERNQKLMDEMQKQEGQLERLTRVFTKWRFITYFSVIFIPPYGLYRVLSKNSTFSKPEKITWTFMIVMIMLYYVQLIVTHFA